MQTRRIDIGGHEVMTFSEGSGDNVVLLVHGGPGCPSDYLRESHFVLAEQGFRCVTWDQLGCGQSDLATHPALFTVERHVAEMAAVCDGLGITRCHVLGQSWGGILGLEFVLAHPGRVRSFVGANTTFDIPRTQRGLERKKQSLGEETCVMMARHEAGGTTAHPEYQAAVTLLMYRHMCRLDTWPPGLRRSMETIGQAPFSLMFGPHFFNCTGSLRDYSRNDRLGEVSVPTLLVQGEHDYVIPDLAATAGTLIPGAVVKLIRNCSHMPFYEDPAAYFAAVVPFLQQH